MCHLPEAVEIKQSITERDDIADLLGLIPTWMISAVVWYTFTKLILDRFTDKKPGTEINAAIIISDIAGVTFPPGVALAAQIDVTLTAMGLILPTPEIPLGTPITPSGVGAALWKEFFAPFFLIVTGGGTFGK